MKSINLKFILFIISLIISFNAISQIQIHENQIGSDNLKSDLKVEMERFSNSKGNNGEERNKVTYFDTKQRTALDSLSLKEEKKNTNNLQAKSNSAFSFGGGEEGIVVLPSPNSMGMVNQVSAEADLYTGKITSSIPITNLKSFDISVPVSLSYNSNGIKVDDLGSWVGLGWNLNAGGSITRIMKNLPDEDKGTWSNGVNSSGQGYTLNTFGFLRLKNEVEIDSDGNGTMVPFSIDLSNYSNYSADDKKRIIAYSDWNSLSGNCDNNEFEECPIGIDTEPDEFYYNFGNYSGKFIFDQDGNIHTIPHQNFDIQKTMINIDGTAKIIKFVVKTPDGFEYQFGDENFESVEQSRLETSSFTSYYEYLLDGSVSGSNPVQYAYWATPIIHSFETPNGECIPNDMFFPGNYKRKVYKKFTSTWKLFKITSPSNDEVNFDYIEETSHYIQNRSSSISLPNMGEVIELNNNTPRLLSLYRDPGNQHSCFSPDLGTNPILQSLTYSVSEVFLDARRLSSISGANNLRLNFEVNNNDRIDLLGAKSLKGLSLWDIDPNSSTFNDGTLIKKWILNYKEYTKTPLIFNGYNGCSSDNRLIFEGESVIDVDYSPSEDWDECRVFRKFHDFFISKYSLEFPNQSIDPSNPHYVSYYNHYADLYETEFNRFVLSSIEETTNILALDSETFITLDYYDEDFEFPKRFSHNKDSWGYFNDNWSGTLVPKVRYNGNGLPTFGLYPNYSTALGWKEGRVVNGELWHYPTSDGHDGTPDASRAQSLLLKNLTSKTGASKRFHYELNDRSNTKKGAGVRVLQIDVDPSGTPSFSQKYTYSGVNYMGGDIRKHQELPYSYYGEYDKIVNISSQPMNFINYTKGARVGYKYVTVENVDNDGEGIGRTEYEFSVPQENPLMDPIITELDNGNDTEVDINANNYPFPPMEESDWKNGLILSVKVFDKFSDLKKETVNNWDYETNNFDPVSIKGLSGATFSYFPDPSPINNDQLNSLGAKKFRGGIYTFTSGRLNLKSSIEKTFFDDPNNPIVTTTNYTYNEKNDLFKKEFISTDGTIFSTEYTRIYDLYANVVSNYENANQACLDAAQACYTACIDDLSCYDVCNTNLAACQGSIPAPDPLILAMLNRNMTSAILENKSLVNGNIVGGTKVTYKSPWANCPDCILPERFYSYEEGDPNAINNWDLKRSIVSVNANANGLIKEIDLNH